MGLFNTINLWRARFATQAQRTFVVAASAVLLASGTVFMWPITDVQAVIPATLPAPTLLSPTNDSTQDGNVLTMDWSDVAGADRYQYNSYHDAAMSSLRWDMEYTPSEKTATNVADAVFWWRVRALESDGTPGEWSELFKVTVDNTPSKPTGLTIFQGDGTGGTELGCTGTTSVPRITVDWADNPEPDIAYYWYGWDNATVTNDHAVKILPGSTQFTGNMTPGNNPYNYTVIAVDTDGNESEKATCGPFTLDQADPVTSAFDTPLDGSAHRKAIKLSGTSTDDFGVDKVNLYYRAAGSTDPWMMITAVDNPGNDTPFTWSYDWTPATDGTYDLKAAAVDNGGNEESSAYASGIVFDNVKPSVGIGVFTPFPGEAHKKNFKIKGTADDDFSGIDYIRIRFRDQNPDGTLGSTIRAEYFATYNASKNTWKTKYMKGDLPDGEYGMIIVAADKAGNANWTMRRFQKIDTVKPTVEITKINEATPASPVNIDGEIKIEGTATDDFSGLAPKGRLVFVNLADKTDKTKFYYPADINWDSATNTWSATIPAGTLPDGEYKVKALAWDKAGNIGRDRFKKIVVDTAPIVSISSPTEGSTVSGTVDVLGSVNDTNLRGYRVVVRNLSTGAYDIDNSYFPSTSSFTGMNVLSWDTTAFDNGDYRIALLGRDDNGNITVERVNVTVDNGGDSTPPTPTPTTTGGTSGTTGGTTGGTTAGATATTPTTTAFVGGGTAVLGVSTGGSTSDGSDSGDDENNDNGEVSGVSDFAQTETLGAEDSSDSSDDECTKLLGICWYWWLLSIPVVILLWYIFGKSREEEE